MIKKSTALYTNKCQVKAVSEKYFHKYMKMPEYGNSGRFIFSVFQKKGSCPPKMEDRNPSGLELQKITVQLRQPCVEKPAGYLQFLR